jgi:hypothetical protein
LTVTPTPSPSSTRTTAVVVVIVAFIAGGFVGLAADHIFLVHHLFFSRGFAAHRIVERLDRELNLTPQQKTAVQQIIERHRARIDAIMGGVRPQVRRELDATNAEIEKVLTPDQRDKFAKMRMRMPRRGMGPHPPPQ